MAGSHRSKRYPNKKHDVLDRGELHRIQKRAVDAARERTVEGHRSAGRKPEVTRRHSGAVVHVDDALRDPEPLLTEDQRLLDSAHVPPDFRAQRFVAGACGSRASSIEGIDTLGDVDARASRSSARRARRPSDPYYEAARRTAQLLAQRRLRDHHRRRPGHHGGGEPRRARRQGPLDRLQHRAAVRAGSEPVHRYAGELPLLLRAQDDVHQVLVRRSSSSPAASARSTSCSRR